MNAKVSELKKQEQVSICVSKKLDLIDALAKKYKTMVIKSVYEINIIIKALPTPSSCEDMSSATIKYVAEVFDGSFSYEYDKFYSTN